MFDIEKTMFISLFMPLVLLYCRIKLRRSLVLEDRNVADAILPLQDRFIFLLWHSIAVRMTRRLTLDQSLFNGHLFTDMGPWAALKLFRFSQISINFHHSTKFFKVFSNFTSSNKFINLTKLECGLVTGERECDWMLNVFILFCCLRHQHWHRTVLC